MFQAFDFNTRTTVNSSLNCQQVQYSSWETVFFTWRQSIYTSAAQTELQTYTDAKH